MSPNPEIQFQPLSSTNPQIRTLTLHPGKPSDPIKCSLHVASLAETPSYEALSYTWGDVSVTRPIEVDGTQFNATVNLERALRHLRDAESDLTLWVDAGTFTNLSEYAGGKERGKADSLWIRKVCINQNDIEEKSAQVAMMGRIYKDCMCVRIWLGCDEKECALQQPLRRVDSMFDDAPERQDPFELVRSLAKDEHILVWRCFQKDETELNSTYKVSARFDAAWKGFVSVAQSAWWTRMWT